ncbi:sigma factor [Streptomyces sp. NPDC014733]|uniref:sigma factor n=1 Tax=Streptomyces sp. NPDC014733 TaxID=3364885 RepID=UPI0036F64918
MSEAPADPAWPEDRLTPTVSVPAQAGAPEEPGASAVDVYTELYAQEHPRLVGYARSLIANAWLAEDVVAEAHFRVWRRINGGHHIDNVPAYLRTTIRHLASSAGSDAAREVPRDPEDGQAWPETVTVGGATPPEDPAQRVAYVDQLARVLDQLPHRWVKALWLAEAEGQPLEAVGKAIGAGKGATAVLLHRAREGMRQAFLRGLPGSPEADACGTHWERMPAYLRGEATARQADGIATHLPDCADCRDRLALLTRANHRLPALTGPALLVFLAGGSAKFLLPLLGAGAGAGAAAAASGTTPAPGSVLGALRRLLRIRSGPAAATAAGVAVVAVAGAAMAAGYVLTDDTPAPKARSQAAAAAPRTPAAPASSDAPPHSPQAPSPAPPAVPPAPGTPAAPSPSPSQSPSASASQSPSASPTTAPPTPGPTAPSGTPTTPGPTPTPTTSPSPSPTPTPTPTETPTPTPTPTPSPTFTQPTASPSPSSTSRCGWHWTGSKWVWNCSG